MWLSRRCHRRRSLESDRLFQQLHQPGGLRGRWWQPDSPNKVLSGAVSITAKDQMKLETERDVDPVEGMKSTFSFSDRSIPVLIGQTHEGTYCTLQGLTLAEGTSYHIPGKILTEVFLVRLAVFEAQVDSFADFKVKDVSIELPILTDWGNASCCSVRTSSRGFTVRARYLRRLPLGNSGNYTGDIAVSAGWSLSVIPSRNAPITQHTRLTVSFLESVSLEVAANLVALIEVFLSLLTLNAVHVPFFHCTSRQVKHMLETRGGKRKSYYVPMLVWRYGMEEEKPYSGLSSDEMFVTYADLQESNQLNMLPTVLARADELGLALSSLVPEGGNFHSYSPHRFLNATQALESLDNLSGHTASLDPASYKKVKKRILEKFEGDDLSWLKDKLDQTGNWPSLAARIQHVIQVNSRLLGTTADEQSGFVRDVVNTRNFLVHLDSSRKQRGVSGIGLIGLTDKAEALARLCFLREIGFDDQSLTRLFSHDERTYIKHTKELFQSQS